MNRYTIRLVIFSAALSLFFTGCDRAKKKGAELLLRRTDSARIAGDYALAYSLLDTLNNTYLTDTVSRREGITLRKVIMLDEAKRNLNYIDSVSPQLQQAIEKAMAGFVKVHNEEYNTTVEYYLPNLLPEKNLQRSYLRASANEYGGFILTSVYRGSRALDHTAVCLTPNGNLSPVYTSVVPYDDGLNYRYRDGGTYVELVTYPVAESMSIGDLFTQAVREKLTIKMDYLAGENKVMNTIRLSAEDILAISRTAELAHLLGEQNRLRKNAETARRRIERLESGKQIEN